MIMTQERKADQAQNGDGTIGVNKTRNLESKPIYEMKKSNNRTLVTLRGSGFPNLKMHVT